MLHMALVFLVIGILAALLGFTTIAGASFAIAKFLAGLVPAALPGLPRYRVDCGAQDHRLTLSIEWRISKPRSSIEPAVTPTAPDGPSHSRSPCRGARSPSSCQSGSRAHPAHDAVARRPARHPARARQQSGIRGRRRSRRRLPADGAGGRAWRAHGHLQGQDDRAHQSGAGLGRRPARLAAGARFARRQPMAGSGRVHQPGPGTDLRQPSSSFANRRIC